MGLITVSVGPDSGIARRPITGHWGRARALERANNLLPWRIGALSEGALESLTEALMACCRHNQRLSDEALVGAALLQASLVTGRPIAVLVSLTIFDRDPKSLHAGDSVGLYRGTQAWAWWLKSGAPSSAQLLSSRERSSYRPTAAELLLWCGDRTKALLVHALERKCLLLTSEGEGHKLMLAQGAWSASVIRRLTTAFLETLPVAQRIALTPKRIENWLFQSVVNQTVDVALAAILVGSSGTISNATVHYTWMSRRRAYEMHHSLVEVHERITTTASSVARHLPHISTLQRKEHIGHGSRFVPTPKLVKMLSGAFHDELLWSKRSVNSVSEFIAFHNAFTLHSIALIGFSTGLRSVTNPIPSRHSVDQTSKFAILNDKGETDPLRDRLAWLPDCAFQQILHYEMHMKTFHLTLQRFGLEGVVDLNLLKTKRTDRQVVLLLHPEKGVVPSPVKTIALAFRKKGFPIRMNAWRHYFRTELVGRLPGDVLHAFLGHWQRGQEPWSGNSCLDPQAYRDALRQPLETLLRRDGWRAMQGLGA